jgi:hypothetical protein
MCRIGLILPLLAASLQAASVSITASFTGTFTSLGETAGFSEQTNGNESSGRQLNFMLGGEQINGNVGVTTEADFTHAVAWFSIKTLPGIDGDVRGTWDATISDTFQFSGLNPGAILSLNYHYQCSGRVR